MNHNDFRIVVLISGSGSNLQAIIDQIRNKKLAVTLSAVVSNKADAYGVQRAHAAGIPTVIINHKDYPDRESFDRAMQQEIDRFKPDLIVLAGFMRILSDAFVQHYTGRMINIHPSLLPDYRGLNTHQRVLDDKQLIHGVSVHFVTPELDGGPVILQSRIRVEASDNAQSLEKKIQIEEHKIYPLVIQWIAQKRIAFQPQGLLFDGKPLSKPLMLDEVKL